MHLPRAPRTRSASGHVRSWSHAGCPRDDHRGGPSPAIVRSEPIEPGKTPPGQLARSSCVTACHLPRYTGWLAIDKDGVARLVRCWTHCGLDLHVYDGVRHSANHRVRIDLRLATTGWGATACRLRANPAGVMRAPRVVLWPMVGLRSGSGLPWTCMSSVSAWRVRGCAGATRTRPRSTSSGCSGSGGRPGREHPAVMLSGGLPAGSGEHPRGRSAAYRR